MQLYGNLANSRAATELGRQQNILGQQAQNIAGTNAGLTGQFNVAGRQQAGDIAYDQGRQQYGQDLARLIEQQNEQASKGFSNAQDSIGKSVNMGGSVVGSIFKALA
jgi:hypothetical protein